MELKKIMTISFMILKNCHLTYKNYRLIRIFLCLKRSRNKL